MNHHIKITPINETYIKVECSEQHIEFELSERFSFKVANAKYDPRVKAGKWDGIKRLYNRQFKRIHKGLLFYVLKFANKSEYSVDLHPSLHIGSGIDLDSLKCVIDDFIQPHDKKNKITPYDYQYEAVSHMLNSGRSICLAATSAGKSLMLYLACRIYQTNDEMEGKTIFIIVPSKMLVEQMYSDFENYSTFEDSKWSVHTFCQKINGEYSKQITKQIVITTWQSLNDIPSYMLADAGAIFVDEVHTVNGPVLTKLLESAVNCSIRHGLTGTLDGMECNELQAQGLMGPAKRIVTAKQLIEDKRATAVKVVCTMLNYDYETKREFYNKQMKLLVTEGKVKPGVVYQSEIESINNFKCRFNFVQKFVSSLKGNTIVLFNRVEDYGLPLYEDMKQKRDNVYLITGSVNGKEREHIRNLLESSVNAIIYATSSIMSTGVSIKNLHNIVCLSSNKSAISTLQTIGRLMRLHESKEHATIYDLVDRLDFNGKQNYTLTHLEERLKFYQAEGHPVKFVTVHLDESKPDSVIVK